MSDTGDGFPFLFATITTDALLEAISRLPHPGNLSQQVRSRNRQVVLVGALATLVGCAPLAEVREINPRLGAQHGTLPQLQRAEQQIANGQEAKRTAADLTGRAEGLSISFEAHLRPRTCPNMLCSPCTSTKLARGSGCRQAYP